MKRALVVAVLLVACAGGQRAAGPDEPEWLVADAGPAVPTTDEDECPQGEDCGEPSPFPEPAELPEPVEEVVRRDALECECRSRGDFVAEGCRFRPRLVVAGFEFAESRDTDRVLQREIRGRASDLAECFEPYATLEEAPILKVPMELVVESGGAVRPRVLARAAAHDVQSVLLCVAQRAREWHLGPLRAQAIVRFHVRFRPELGCVGHHRRGRSGR